MRPRPPVASARQQGDETALYRQHAAQLQAIVRHEVTTSRENVEDACAFAWTQLLRYQPDRAAVLAWLCRTAIRVAIKLDRRQRRDVDVDLDLDAAAEHSATASQPIAARVELLAARELIGAAGLRPREAHMLALHIAGFTYTDIAKIDQVSKRTVERQLLRARHKIKQAARG